eukprot:jgi/Orpsp1_1/1185382/evm.model.c7180000093502.1
MMDLDEKNIIQTETETEVIPLLLRIKECKKVNKEKKTAIFITENNEEIELKYKTISDPSYDIIFKKIFYDHSPVNKDIDGKKRLISLINGIFFPNISDDGFKVKEIQYIQNEIVTYGKKDRSGTFIFDVPCICTCWNYEIIRRKKRIANKTLFGIDIEMQIKYQKEYVERFYKYNIRLCSYYRQPFIVISLLNFKDKTALLENYNKCNNTNDNNNDENTGDKNSRDKDIRDENIENKNTENNDNGNKNTSGNKNKASMSIHDSHRSVGVGPSYFDGARNPSKLIEHLMNNTFFFDLNGRNNDFLSNIPFLINCEEIDNTAKAWLKLFSLRQWSMKEDKVTLDKYVIPDDVEGLAKEVVEAIKILELISDNELEEAMLHQYDIIVTYENERIAGKNEGLKEADKKIKEIIEETDKEIEEAKKEVKEKEKKRRSKKK